MLPPKAAILNSFSQKNITSCNESQSYPSYSLVNKVQINSTAIFWIE
jgi:hypothetical protein